MLPTLTNVDVHSFSSASCLLTSIPAYTILPLKAPATTGALKRHPIPGTIAYLRRQS